MTITTSDDPAGGPAASPMLRRLTMAAVALSIAVIGTTLFLDWQNKRAMREAIYDFRVAEHYCGACHTTLGTWESILIAAEETEGGLGRYMLDLAEADFMPPSAWHRQQLIEILNARGK